MSVISKPRLASDDDNPRKRMEYEAMMQMRDQAYLFYEMLQAQGYHSGPIYDLKNKLDELSREVSRGI